MPLVRILYVTVTECILVYRSPPLYRCLAERSYRKHLLTKCVKHLTGNLSGDKRSLELHLIIVVSAETQTNLLTCLR